MADIKISAQTLNKELTRMLLLRDVKLSEDQQRVWIAALSQYDTAWILAGIRYLHTHKSDRFLNVPLIVECAEIATGKPAPSNVTQLRPSLPNPHAHDASPIPMPSHVRDALRKMIRGWSK